MASPLFTDSDWDFPLLEKLWETIDDIGKNTLGFDYYDAQIEIISSEQMIDNYSTHALPQMYNHWSFGKSFIQNDNAYKKGQQGLAYEVVINTNPSIAYLMENNTATMQALVLAHASVGHSGFFKTNYLFTGWTEADSILGYLSFAKEYIKECEMKHGKLRVELLLDSAHALQMHGVDKYKKPRMTAKKKAAQEHDRQAYDEGSFSDMWRTTTKDVKETNIWWGMDDEPADINEENLLLFIETNSPSLEPWQRNILGIVRKVAQYFYPQRQTSLMNEGFACLTHHTIMTELHDRGLITDGSFLEFLDSHSGVVYQPAYNEKRYSGITYML
jgi:stage V sporulation protein R